MKIWQRVNQRQEALFSGVTFLLCSVSELMLHSELFEVLKWIASAKNTG
jgi:hypothetical protein